MFWICMSLIIEDRDIIFCPVYLTLFYLQKTKQPIKIQHFKASNHMYIIKSRT